MENNSASATSDDSRITFPPDAFWWLPTIGTALGILVILFAVLITAMVSWIVQHGYDAVQLNRTFSGFYGITVQSIAEVLIVAYLLLLTPILGKTTLQRIGFRKARSADWIIVLLAIVGMFVFVNIPASLLTTALHFKSPELAMSVYTHSSGFQKVLFAVFGVILAPVFEESVFRVFLFNAFRKWWGFWPGAIVSSLLFGLAHIQPPWIPAMFLSLTLPLAVGGMVLAYVYTRTGKAWASMVTHGAFNGITLLAVVLFPQLAK